jgi:hypothetical protein
VKEMDKQDANRIADRIEQLDNLIGKYEELAPALEKLDALRIALLNNPTYCRFFKERMGIDRVF